MFSWIPDTTPTWLFVMAAMFIGLVVYHHVDLLRNHWDFMLGLSHRADSFEEETEDEIEELKEKVERLEKELKALKDRKSH